MKSLSAPLDVCLGITGACNLRCRHCSSRRTWTTKDLSTSGMLKIIDQLGRAKVFRVALFGGEPMMRPDLYQLLGRLNRYPVMLSMNSNGLLIDRAAARRLAGTHRVREFVISLDGSRPVHDRMRGAGSYDGAVRGIRHLRAVGARVTISFTVTRINQRDIEFVAALGERLGVSVVRYNHIFYGGNAACFLREVFVAPHEDRELCERIFRLSGRYPGLIAGSYLQQRDKLLKVGSVPAARRSIRVPPCGAATRQCTIRPDGVVTPCEIIWDVAAGDLSAESFADVWRHSPVLNAFRRTRVITLHSVSACSSCEYQFVCFQGHRCYPYHYPGGLDDKRLYCQKQKARPA